MFYVFAMDSHYLPETVKNECEMYSFMDIWHIIMDNML